MVSPSLLIIQNGVMGDEHTRKESLALSPSIIKDRVMNTAAKVVTVTGEISPNEMGVCDAHNHVWIDPVAGVGGDAPVLNNREGILGELILYKDAGGDAITDCQPGGCGRNGKRLVDLAQTSGVKIIACTGFHRTRYYPEDYWMWKTNAGEITDYLVSEIRSSLDEARGTEEPVRAGFIKIACESQLSQTPQPALEAAADTVAETSSAIEVHTEKGAEAEGIVNFLISHKVPPGRIILCHMDKRPDFSLHCELARGGILLEYDTFYRTKYDPEHNLWPLIEKMAVAGLCNQVALATDMAEKALWQQLGGGLGLVGFPQSIQIRLRQTGLDEDCVDRMMGKNILQRLAQLAPG
jgi:5-phospho-D-xylono-1,4-lactonase